jgi:ubiquinone/menaquinone biosynthesis C-methylase UbiE
MTIYDRYAPLYDQSGQVRFALLTHIYLGELLARHPAPGRRALDLACGTGTLAALLAGEGWEVAGVDASPQMLALAAAKLADADLAGSARLIQGDMRHLDGLLPPAAFDLATCAYDSLNYMLSAADLAACFAGVARALAPGGVFVGDMNTRHFLEHEWPPCEVREQDGYVQIERAAFDAQTGVSTMLLSGFVGDDAAGYERFDEIHHERAYPPAEIDALLAAAGLAVEARYDSFTLSPPGPHSQRIFWVARRASTAD